MDSSKLSREIKMVSTRLLVALVGASAGVSGVLAVSLYGQCGGIGYTVSQAICL